jgi:hypothetical protein
VEVEKTLQENGDGDDGAAEEEPHQRAAFGDQIHGERKSPLA